MKLKNNNLYTLYLYKKKIKYVNLKWKDNIFLI